MLPPEFFDNAADELLELYSELENTITKDIVRRIVKTEGVSDTAAWQIQKLQESGMVYDDVIRAVAQMTDASDQHVKALFEDAGIEAMQYDIDIYQAAGLSPPALRQSASAMQVLQAGMQKTAGHLRNLSMTTAITTQQAFINAVTLAEMQIESGAFGYTTSIRNAIKTAAKAGTKVSYPSGHIDRLDVAIRRATLTGVSQTTGKISEHYADMMGCDLVEVTAHTGARPEHAEWQGKIFSRSGRHKKYPDFKSATGYGTGPGLKGWNCRHDFFPFFEGISESAYPREKLKEYENQTVTYNGQELKYYDATQLQRRMEREIRASKRQLVAYNEAMTSGNEKIREAMKNDFMEVSAGLKQQEAHMKEFVKQTGMYRQSEREQLLGFNRSVAQKAVHANKAYLKAQNQ